MGAQIREMVLADYEAVVALWKSTPGVDIRPVTDSRDGIERLLARNPGLSVVAVNNGELVGCALASHDGRRGFLQHVVVAQDLRGQGLARAMIGRCLERLREHHLGMVHLDVVVDNETAMAFWQKAGWHRVDTLTRLSLAL
ncbi:acetyltransferase [Caballeronia udeis]|uniref:Acetyltransferase n=1 Tax=Caballeronia udeis TaxID=1232866 RepID=A0A158GEI7_9BURK|nr:GNAT family N-acetyltransferase [Caballeronia udeis]SAL30432.1 acetyltransferase [Caballeronia udeis]